MTIPEHWRPYFDTVLACLLVVLVSSALLPVIDIVHIGLLCVLTVALIAVRYGRGPALFAAVFAGLLFNFFFIWPPLGFAFRDPQYLLTFATMLVVGVLAGHVTAGLRFQASVAARREARAQALSAFAREMSAAVDTGQVVAQAQRVLGELLGGRVVVLLPGADGALAFGARIDGLDPALAAWALRHDAPAGLGTTQQPDAPFHCIPLRAPGGSCGVLAMAPHSPRALPAVLPELDAFARLVAIAVERIHLVEVAQDMRFRAAAENLRNSMLAAISHDLRTPLAGLIGLVDALELEYPPGNDVQRAMIAEIRESALHMSRMVNNLLDMARIHSGDIRLRHDWNSVEETIGSVLRLLRMELAERPVSVRIPEDFPLVEFDALLVERIIANLVGNAARHAPAGSSIAVVARVEGDNVAIDVEDSGPGLPPGVDPFARKATAGPGAGLGLAISRAFAEAHGGSIAAANRAGGGAVFTLRLPRSTPPDAGLDEPRRRGAA